MNYGNTNVDERYSSIVEPNLYFDNIFEPGITYNDTYQGDANSGLVKIYKEESDGAVGAGTPAGDFTDEDTKNSLLDLRLNNAFRKSKKIYKVTANAVPYQLGDQTLSTAIKDCQQGEMAAGLACLTHEGTDLGDTTAITSKNVKSMILKARVKARKGKASPNVVLASVDVFSAMLEAAGDQFTPVYNDETVRTGQVGYWLGMLWKEANAMETTEATYYDHAGTKQTEDLTKVDFIMYDWKAFHKVDNLEEIRIIDSENFVGSKAQVEFNDGLRVSNAARVIVKKNS